MPSMKINGKKVKFKIVKGTDGCLSLKATEVNGEEVPCGYLLKINKDGTFRMELGVNDEFGFKLAARSKITVV